MKKKIALGAMLLGASVLLSGCNLIGYDEALDGAQVVAKVNDAEITKADWEVYRDYLVEYDQEYMRQNYGITMPVDETTMANYGELAVEQLVESAVIENKLNELGMAELTEEETAEVEEYVTSTLDLYKLLIRYQNYAGLETVEEEQARIAELTAQAEEAAASEETPSEPIEIPEAVATVTDEMLNTMLENDLATMGYGREYLMNNQMNSKIMAKLRDYVCADVEVSDEQVQNEYASRVAKQKETYDANPAAYANAERNGTALYYMPEGYRGVKNLLVMIDSAKRTEINTLKSDLTNAQNVLTSAAKDLAELNEQDVTAMDEDAKTAYTEQKTALEEQVADAQATIDETQTKLDALTEEAFAEILPKAQELLAQAQAGEDFDALIETAGEDSGMKSEPNKTRGYLVCEGMTAYEQAFQDAAMALETVGAISAEPVKTSYGYHILQYAGDIAGGEVELTDEVKTTIHTEMLTEAKTAAFDAAVTQWVSEATVKTFPKIMK